MKTEAKQDACKSNFNQFLLFPSFYLKAAFLTALVCLTLGQTTLAQYTLQDDDVVVLEGLIQSCSYDFAIKDIIIPEVLDGQVVTGIVDGWDDDNYFGYVGPFTSKGISSIVFPSSLLTIGAYSCAENQLTSIDLSKCTSLTTIGDYAFETNTLTVTDFSNCSALASIGTNAFAYNSLTDLDFSNCSALTSIGAYAFYSSSLTSMDFSGCDRLQIIGNRAFAQNAFISIDLSDCFALEIIRDYAFSDNMLSSINLSGCTALTNIGKGVFANNDNLVGFYLPVNQEFAEFDWKNAEGNVFAGGILVNNLETYYYVPAPYSLQDKDVIVSDGVIQSCSYDFAFKVIEIPEILDGQKIIGIAEGYVSNGVFQNRRIVKLSLPSSIENIGDLAFAKNEISSLDLSNCKSLKSIGVRAFYSNRIVSANFKGCSGLTTIAFGAFQSNQMEILDLSTCTTLEIIGSEAFGNNVLSAIDLSNCTSLLSISKRAFTSNFLLKSFTLPSNAEYQLLGWRDINGNELMGGDEVSDKESFYLVPLSYTITDDDVVVEDGIIQSCSYDFERKVIVIPEILDGQVVIRTNPDFSSTFSFKGIIEVTLPATLESIGRYGFEGNYLTDLNLGACTSLSSIQHGAFGGNRLSSIDLSTCISLKYIGSIAFFRNEINSFMLPIPQIPGNVFDYWIDDDGTIFEGGELVSDLGTAYRAQFSHAYCTVSSPAIGDEWQTSTFHQISWEDNISEKNTIDLYNGDVLVFSIAGVTRNDGDFGWSVPSGLPGGSEYRIKVSSLSDPEVYGFSDYFSILYQAPCPDSYEPSDAFFKPNVSAFSRVLGEYRIEEQISGTVHKPGDWDHYLVSVVEVGSLDLTLINIPEGFDLQLYDGDRNYLAGSFSSGDEEISKEITVPGDYIVIVGSLNKAASCSPYELQLNWTPGLPACKDTYEPSNEFFKPNQTAFSRILKESFYTRSISGTIHKPGDWDHYRVNVYVPGTLMLILSEVPEGFDLQLYDGNRNYITGSFTFGDEEILEAITSPGEYIVIVGSLKRAASCSPYELQLSWSPGLPGCRDIYEPSGKFVEPNVTAFSDILGSSSYEKSIGATIHKAGDWDHYRIMIGEVGRLSLTLDNVPDAFDLQLYDGNRNYMAGSFEAGDEEIAETITSPGPYIVIVGSLNRAASCMPYNLGVDWLPESLKKSTDLNSSGLDITTFTVFPIPGLSSIYLKSNVDINEELAYAIYDPSGKLLISKILKRMRSEEPIEINISGYESGLYYMQVYSSTLRETIKIIKY